MVLSGLATERGTLTWGLCPSGLCPVTVREGMMDAAGSQLHNEFVGRNTTKMH